MKKSNSEFRIQGFDEKKLEILYFAAEIFIIYF
jgi:hypothetical protein